MSTHAPSQPNLVPAAVRRQAAEADRLLAELNARPAAPAQPPQTAVSDAPRGDWTPATPAPAVQPGIQEQQPPRQAAPPPTAATIAAAAAAGSDAPSDAEELRRLRAAYSSLQGKYNSEIAGLRAVTREQSELLNTLVQQQSRPAPTPAKEETAEEFMKRLGATDKEIEDYGELLPVVVKLAKSMFQPTIAKLEGELQRLQNSQVQQQQMSAQQRKEQLEDELTDAVPNWRVINESQEFLDWLDQFDIMAGATRRAALSAAYKALDIPRVVGIFQMYVREYPAAMSASGGPLVSPETLIQPQPRGGAAPAPEGQGGGRLITESEIREFYARVRRKQVRPEEYARFSAELAAATKAGRVRPDRIDHHANG